jgi:type II secretory pathway component PulL
MQVMATPLSTLLVEQAAAILSGRTSPWFDLRPGFQPAESGAGRLLPRVLTAAAAFLMLNAGAAGWWRAHTYDRQSLRLQQTQQAVFQDLFPGRPIPVGIKSRLQSELARRRGVELKTDAGSTISATRLMHAALCSLPTRVRFRLLEMRTEPGRVVLEGQSRSHTDAESLAVALHAAPGEFVFDPEAPRSESQSDKSVSFTLTAAASTRAHDAVPPTPLAGTAP